MTRKTARVDSVRKDGTAIKIGADWIRGKPNSPEAAFLQANAGSIWKKTVEFECVSDAQGQYSFTYLGFPGVVTAISNAQPSSASNPTPAVAVPAKPAFTPANQLPLFNFASQLNLRAQEYSQCLEAAIVLLQGAEDKFDKIEMKFENTDRCSAAATLFIELQKARRNSNY